MRPAALHSVLCSTADLATAPVRGCSLKPAVSLRPLPACSPAFCNLTCLLGLDSCTLLVCILLSVRCSHLVVRHFSMSTQSRRLLICNLKSAGLVRRGSKLEHLAQTRVANGLPLAWRACLRTVMRLRDASRATIARHLRASVRAARACAAHSAVRRKRSPAAGSRAWCTSSVCATDGLRWSIRRSTRPARARRRSRLQFADPQICS